MSLHIFRIRAKSIFYSFVISSFLHEDKYLSDIISLEKAEFMNLAEAKRC